MSKKAVCGNCGESVYVGDRFCIRCGKPLTGQIHSFNKLPSEQPKTLLSEGSASNLSCEVNIKEERPDERKTAGERECESFIAYVNEHIRKTTAFNSAQELITKSNPWQFAWNITGVCALIGLIAAIINGANVLMAVLLLGLMGVGMSFVVAIPLASQYEKRFSSEINIDKNIDIADLCKFLTNNLHYIDPSFGQWSLVIKRGLVAIVENKVAEMAGEVTIGCEYGANRKNLAEIIIRNQPGNRIYHVSSGYNGFMLNFSWDPMLSRSCLIKTAPILQAAMEYYIHTIA